MAGTKLSGTTSCIKAVSYTHLDVYKRQVQAISRDILCSALMTFKYSDIVMHVHDEIVIEADPRMSVEAVCKQMSRTPEWADGLLLDADGFTCDFYQKD